MKRILLLASVLVLFAVSNAFAFTFEPNDLIQLSRGNDEPEWRINISYGVDLYGNEPAQMGVSRDDNFVKQRYKIGVWATLWESSDAGKIKVYLGPTLATHEDIYDGFTLASQIGYEFPGGKAMLYVIDFRKLDFGRPNRDHGISCTGAGGRLRLYERTDFFLDAYGHGYASCDTEAGISEQIHSGVKNERKILRGDAGVVASYRFLEYFTIYAKPFALFAGDGSVGQAGMYAGLTYELGRNFAWSGKIGLFRNLTLELITKYAEDPRTRQEERQIELRVNLPLGR